jgi:hypothetical protein
LQRRRSPTNFQPARAADAVVFLSLFVFDYLRQSFG